jgi:hypothetical protein
MERFKEEEDLDKGRPSKWKRNQLKMCGHHNRSNKRR